MGEGKEQDVREKLRLEKYGHATETAVSEGSTPQGRIEHLQDLFIDLERNLDRLEEFIEWLVRAENKRQIEYKRQIVKEMEQEEK